MALSLGYDSHTEIGLVRSNNQDSAYTSPRMLMVADGMGGAAAGDLASAVAVWELRRTDEDLDARVAAARAEREASGGHPLAEGEEDPGDLVDVLTVLAGTLVRANARLVELVEDDPSLAGMGTTVCGFVLADDRLAVVNIGDSRAYLIRDGQLHRVTRDHSWVQTLVDDGRITEEEALEHPHRSLVLRVLNGSSQHEPDLGWLDIVAGDRVMVCSDGLCGLVTDAVLAPVLTAGRPRQETIDDLVALAHEAGGHDNITIILADVEADGPPGAVATIGSAATIAAPGAVEHTLAIPTQDELHPEEAKERAITEEERYSLTGRRKASAWVRVTLAFVLPLLTLAGGGALWYQYTQTRYFIGPADAQVALYRGIPERVLGVSLSTLVETDATRIADLPPYYAEKVHATIPVDDLTAARSTLAELREKAAQCIAQREARARATEPPMPPASTETPASAESPVAEPVPSSPVALDPTASPVLSANPSIVPADMSPTPSSTPVTAPEDC